MQSMESLKAEYDAKLAKLAAEIALAAKCPVPPKSVQLTSGGLAPWISYECASLVDALDLLERLGPVVPSYGYKGTFTRFQPEALADAKSGEVTSGPFAASILVSQGEGFGPDATLKAFFHAGDTLCEAHIKLHGFRDGGHAYAATPIHRTAKENSAIIGWNHNRDLSAESDKLTKWGTGSNDSARFEYHYMADHEDGGADHAMAQLRIAAERMRRTSFRSSPMAESFLGVLLEDLQMREREEAFGEEREAKDCGTIWTCPESTFRFALNACRKFRDAFPWTDEAMREVLEANAEQAGSDLYLEMAGHGAGFRDRNVWAEERDAAAEIAEKLSAAVDGRGTLETYIGDDSRAWVVGSEGLADARY